ncbi:MAG: hypothetical protein CL840_20380 [Crocinitomicaceae bacterium]|nr:hypothetical protein [Crocinitomicaceae bacterium]|tara:strand:+ start:15346 stop:16086 length:741 start_codon:yes stop_codon:yes gene_type:complete
MIKSLNKVFTILLTSAFVITASAQKLQISLGAFSGTPLGDFTKKDINDPTAGYALYNSGANLEIKYYFDKLGLGLRGSFGSYYRDYQTYQDDLVKQLGITDDNYDFSMTNTFFTASPQIGISYRFKLAKKLILEPYFFAGATILTTPVERGVYHISGTTYHYEKKPQLYYGLNYIPGLKFQWNIWKHIGAAAFVEYEGSSLRTENETVLVYSANTYNKTEVSKSYNPQTIGGGLSLLIYFGLEEKE